MSAVLKSKKVQLFQESYICQKLESLGFMCDGVSYQNVLILEKKHLKKTLKKLNKILDQPLPQQKICRLVEGVEVCYIFECVKFEVEGCSVTAFKHIR